MAKVHPVTVFLPDTRGVSISRFGIGNAKLGFGVMTYSRLAGREGLGTCPGSTDECERICYAKRITGPVVDVYRQNSGSDVPPLPADCRVLRIHVSGDFDTVEYIGAWIARLTERPDVTAWAYTRSWRVPHLLESLERLRALPNLQLFASMDPSCRDVPPAGWRRAWIDRPIVIGEPADDEIRLVGTLDERSQTCTLDGTPSYVCPEETGHKRDCLSCGYCFEGKRNDVTFIEHTGRKHPSE